MSNMGTVGADEILPLLLSKGHFSRTAIFETTSMPQLKGEPKEERIKCETLESYKFKMDFTEREQVQVTCMLLVLSVQQ